MARPILLTEVCTKCAPLNLQLAIILLGRLPPTDLTCSQILLVTLTRPVFGRGIIMTLITGTLPTPTQSCALRGFSLVWFMLSRWTTWLVLLCIIRLPNLREARTSFSAWTASLAAPFLTSFDGSLMPLWLSVSPMLVGATLHLVTPVGLSYSCTEQCPLFYTRMLSMLSTARSRLPIARLVTLSSLSSECPLSRTAITRTGAVLVLVPAIAGGL